MASRRATFRSVLTGWLLFVVYLFGSFAVLYSLDRSVVTPFTRGIAQLTKLLLALVGVQAQVSGVVVGTPSFSVAIQNNCNAIYETALFISAVLAYPATWRERAWGALVGFAALYVVNLIRVLSLIYIGSHFRQYFQLGHIYVWQSLFIAFALGLWILWAGKFVQSART
jgi:exosortase H (IPTLxxWG-CTERM-specific)